MKDSSYWCNGRRSRITKKSNKIRQTTVIANCEYIEGSIGEHKLLVKSGIGKVNAAMSTTILLKSLNLM